MTRINFSLTVDEASEVEAALRFKAERIHDAMQGIPRDDPIRRDLEAAKKTLRALELRLIATSFDVNH